MTSMVMYKSKDDNTDIPMFILKKKLTSENQINRPTILFTQGG